MSSVKKKRMLKEKFGPPIREIEIGKEEKNFQK